MGGALYAHAGLEGYVTWAGHLCIERPYVQLEAWGKLAQGLQESMSKGREGGRSRLLDPR